jgi:hypothetical protein
MAQQVAQGLHAQALEELGAPGADAFEELDRVVEWVQVAAVDGDLLRC